MISFFVEEFLTTHDADLTTSDLNILEKEVQNAVRLKNIDEQTSARLRKANGDSRNGNNNDNNNNNNNNTDTVRETLSTMIFTCTSNKDRKSVV